MGQGHIYQLCSIYQGTENTVEDELENVTSKVHRGMLRNVIFQTGHGYHVHELVLGAVTCRQLPVMQCIQGQAHQNLGTDGIEDIQLLTNLLKSYYYLIAAGKSFFEGMTNDWLSM